MVASTAILPAGAAHSRKHTTERATTCANVQCQGAPSGTTVLATTEPYKLTAAVEAASASRLLCTAPIFSTAQRLWRHADADRDHVKVACLKPHSA